MNLNVTVFISVVFLHFSVITQVRVRGMVFKCNVLGWDEILFMASIFVTFLDEDTPQI